MGIEKTWFYKNGIENEPQPILLIRSFQFNDFCVITYREVDAEGNLSYEKQDIIRNGENVIGLNEFKKFPEIKIKYCKRCGEIE